MKRILSALAVTSAAITVLLSACTPAAKTGQQRAETAGAGDSHHQSSGRHAAAAPDPRTAYSPAAGRTFLDTLNQGREIALAPEDLPALEVATVNLTAARAPQAHGEQPPTPAEGPRFRIQILALSQIDRVRQEKLNVEAAVNLPVFMSEEQSLYKLYVGEFKTRQEAEAALPEIKKKGYTDAWIVNK